MVALTADVGAVPEDDLAAFGRPATAASTEGTRETRGKLVIDTVESYSYFSIAQFSCHPQSEASSINKLILDLVSIY